MATPSEDAVPCLPGSVNLLEADPELAEDLHPRVIAMLGPHLMAQTAELPVGPWTPPLIEGDRRGHLGLLVLDGLLTRDVRLATTNCAELLAAGDLLRPWEPGEELPFSVEVGWEVLTPTRVAVLDRRLTATVGRAPELNTALMGRAVRRSRWLALHLAIRCLRRVDVRLLVLFWHLAERWGRVTREGIVLPLPFTHDLLGRLVGAQRPTVTTALGQLAAREVVRRRDGSWLLSAELPEELERMDAGGAASGVAEGRSRIFVGEGRPPAVAMSEN